MSYLPEHEIEDSMLNLSRTMLGADRLIVLRVDSKKKPILVVALGDQEFAKFDRLLPSLNLFEATIEVDDTGVATAIGRYSDANYLVAQFQRLQASSEDTLAQIHNLLPHLAALSNSKNCLDVKRLPGRAASLEHMQRQIDTEIWTERRRSFAVIRASLASLDHINHFYGWDVANQLIDILKSRLDGPARKDMFVGYLGGGQFIFVTPPGRGNAVISERLSMLRNATSAAIHIDEIRYTPDVNFAAVTYPDSGLDPASLLRAADVELQKKSKNRLLNLPCVIDGTAPSLATAQSFEQDLQNAIERRELYLDWQPTTALSTMKTISREALLRWARPNFGIVSAASLIPCAETSGLIDRLDEWSLRAACNAAKAWADELTVCVNISPTWLAEERLARLVDDVLSETGLPPRRLQIDFTEKTDFGPNDSVYRELVKLRALGVTIALDDFGTGYSSLERLSYYPVDKIKIARSFLLRLDEDSRSCRIMQHIVHLARSLNIVCCAKGVETEHQMAFVTSYGYEEAQGFLIGHPRQTVAPRAPALLADIKI